jgi:hypothetical protein
MKRFALPLGVAAFALACSDNATSPDRHAALTLKDPTVAAALGDKPPPPVDAVIDITISSPGSALFTGVYFSNGKISDDGIPEPTLDGTAWLRLDNTQLTRFGTASPNTRFMVKGDDTACPVDPSTCPTGIGTFSFLEPAPPPEVGFVVVMYKIVRVDRFIRFNRCGAPLEDVEPSPCASITFRAEVVGGPPCNLETGAGCHIGHAEAFDRASCLSSNSDRGFFIDPSCLPSSGEG